MLKRLRARSFKSLADVTVEFPRMSVFLERTRAGRVICSTRFRLCRVSVPGTRSATRWGSPFGATRSRPSPSVLAGFRNSSPDHRRASPLRQT